MVLCSFAYVFVLRGDGQNTCVEQVLIHWNTLGIKLIKYNSEGLYNSKS